MVSIAFSIDNQSNSFYPGDKITGLLTLKFISRASIKGITLNCIGKSKVAWSLVSQVHFKEKIDFLETRETNFECGSSVYPFSFQLPPVGLPCSFVSQHGTIKYYLHAIVKTQTFQHNAEGRYPFDVIGVVDLNSKGPVLQKPTEISQMKSFSCSRGSVGYSFLVSKSGFVPGEHLCFQVEVVNNTNKPIDFLSVNIGQEMVFTGKKLLLPKEYIYNTFMEVRGPRISALEEKSWTINEEDGIVIEQLPPTRRRDIVRINYAIQIALKIRRGGKLCGSIPIVIGTVPFAKELLEGSSLTSGIRKIENQPFHDKQ